MAKLDFLRKIAPMIGTALSFGGPIGAMAGGVLTKVLQVKTTDGQLPTVDDVAAAVAASPDQAAAIASIKKAEQDFQVQMRTLEINSVQDLEKLASDDRADARARQIAVRDRVPALLAFVITVGFFATLWWVFLHGVQAEARDMAHIMVGTLGTAWVAVVSYYFGSSAGSDRKTEILAEK